MKKIQKIALLAAALLATACGINPAEGEYGVVAVVPEQDSCWVNYRVTETRQAQRRGLCDTEDHEIEVLGLWRFDAH